jgi:N-acetylglucosamine-6-phosphate deacetylase
MVDAVTFMHRQVGLPLEEALRMASTYPAEAMGLGAERGHLEIGAIADFIHLSDDLLVQGTWIGGDRVFTA